MREPSDRIGDDLVDRFALIDEPVDKGRVGAVLEQPPYQIGKQIFVTGRWTSYPLSRTGWLRLRHALASRDEGMELVSMKEGSGLRLCWCAVVRVKENLPLQQHAGHPKQPVGDTA